MRLRFHLVLVAALALAGCTANGTAPEHGVPANMTELKGALGALPTYEPPAAKAQANVSVASVGSPIRFTTEGTVDPQGFPLAYAWDFGDGETGEDATVEHAYAASGEYVARVTVTNEKGLADVAVLNVRIVGANRAPVAVLRILDGAGQPATLVERGVRVVFDASLSSDDGPFNVDWDFGDGTTSHALRAGHVYATPGRYVAKLQVVDGDGLMAREQALVRVNAQDETKGEFVVTDVEAASYPFHVSSGVTKLALTLAFDGGFGSNDLKLVLRDAGAREVARSAEATSTGAKGTITRTILLDAAQLAPYHGGTWRAEIVPDAVAPTGVAWTLTVRQLY